MILQLPEPRGSEAYLYVEPIPTKKISANMLLSKKGMFCSNSKESLINLLSDAYYDEVISDPGKNPSRKDTLYLSIDDYPHEKLLQLLEARVLQDTRLISEHYQLLKPHPFMFKQGYTKKDWEAVKDWFTDTKVSVFGTGSIVSNFSEDWLVVQMQAYFLRLEHDLIMSDVAHFHLTSYRQQNDIEREQSKISALETAIKVLETHDEFYNTQYMKQLETYSCEFSQDKNCRQFLQLIDGALHTKPGDEKYALHIINKEINNLFAYISERYEEIKK